MRLNFASLILPPFLAFGCSSDKPKAALPLDCSAGDGYEFFGADGLASASTQRYIYDFEVGDTAWYQAGDCTGGRWDPNSDGGACVVNPSTASPIIGDIPGATIDGGRCGSFRSALIESYGHNDWGSMYASWDLTGQRPPANGTGSDGIAFWARNPDRSGHATGVTNKTIWFEVGDWRQVVAQNTVPAYPPPGDFRCVPAPITTSTSGYTDTGQVTTTTRIPEPDECGNLFKRPVLTSNEWHLYLLPWTSFFQETTPNRNPDGIDTRDIRILQVNIPIGSTVELWLDDISFYRKRQGDAGN